MRLKPLMSASEYTLQELQILTPARAADYDDEKDAINHGICASNWWYLPVDAVSERSICAKSSQPISDNAKKTSL